MVAIERRDLSMAFGKWGRYANQSNLLSLSERFLISQEQATYIIATMAEEVKSTWYEVAKTSGVTEIDCMKIRSAFVYEGFFFDLRSLTSPQRPMEP
jgi:serine/threonine-protein kinase HipA